jgi:D-alanyl-D-alanine carboxypeptidase (penicillin-binding protein 5/6)
MKFTLKKLITLFLITTIILSTCTFTYAISDVSDSTSQNLIISKSEEPDIISQSAILMDSNTGKILYSKNETSKMYPASTTKIVTAILVLENCNLDDIVTVDYDAVMSIPDGYSTAYLQINEQLTVEQLLQLLLIHSANDAANVLAQYVGGSIESFVSMMNTKVNELGLSNTHFTNAYGMHDENHYTTAQDLAIIMKYCIKNEDFRRIAGSASCAIPATNAYGTRQYTSTNELIIPNNSNYYPYLTSGKTGYTSQAGDCLVSSSYKDDLELICVILGGKTVNGVSTRFLETKTLYQYGYNNYSIQTLLNEDDIVTQIDVKNATKDSKNLDLLANSSISALLENTVSKEDLNIEINLNDNIKAPIQQGDSLGSVSYVIDGIEYKTDLIASHSVEKSQLLDYIIKIGISILILILIYKIFFMKKKKKYKKRVYKI